MVLDQFDDCLTECASLLPRVISGRRSANHVPKLSLHHLFQFLKRQICLCLGQGLSRLLDQGGNTLLRHGQVSLLHQVTHRNGDSSQVSQQAWVVPIARSMEVVIPPGLTSQAVLEWDRFSEVSTDPISHWGGEVNLMGTSEPLESRANGFPDFFTADLKIDLD